MRRLYQAIDESRRRDFMARKKTTNQLTNFISLVVEARLTDPSTFLNSPKIGLSATLAPKNSSTACEFLNWKVKDLTTDELARSLCVA